LPVTSNDIRRYNEGCNSITNIIPTPKIHKHGPTETAYVLLHDILSLYLPYGLPIACKNTTEVNDAFDFSQQLHCSTGYWDTRRVHDLCSVPGNTGTDVKKILISLWSDGCDPNARNKTNRGSMHITTVTFLSDVNRNDAKNTFVLAIGREGEDHSEVREILYNDIKRLANGHKYYDGKGFVELEVILVCNLADRPERSENTGFGSHMGDLTVRWGHVCNISPILHSCDSCNENRMNNIPPYQECADCYDWSFDRIMIEVDKDFPQEVEECTDGFIASHIFSYKNAITACEIACANITSRKWGHAKFKSYLRHQGINNKVINKVLENVTSESPVDLYKVCPSVWNPKYNFDVNSFVPAIMHLCFLGITQTTGMVIRESFTNSGKYTKFRERDMMKHMRGFSITWCRTWTYGSSKTQYGAWTAENYLAYSRIFKSVYSLSSSLFTDRTQDEANTRVATLIQRLASALHAMIARIMQLVVTDFLIQDTDRHIKLFLSVLTELDDVNHSNVVAKQKKGKKEKRTVKRKRKINSTSNLTSLLNLPQFMKEFGSPRLYWEGGYKGEGILRAVKPVVTQGTHMTYFATAALHKYYSEKSMDMLLNSEREGGDVITYNGNLADKHIYTYKNGMAQIIADICNGKPISATRLDSDGTIYCSAVHNKKKLWSV
jgi:hypothetical protein